VTWHICIHFDSHLQTLQTVRKLAKAAAVMEHASEAVAGDVELAMGEVLSNACLHAYGGGVGPLDVEMSFDGNALTFVVHDAGEPITDRLVVPAHLPADLSGRGRGLYLTGQVMDEVEIVHPDRQNRGTAVRMKKYLTAGRTVSRES